jgi:hypothetical protein
MLNTTLHCTGLLAEMAQQRVEVWVGENGNANMSEKAERRKPNHGVLGWLGKRKYQQRRERRVIGKAIISENY